MYAAEVLPRGETRLTDRVQRNSLYLHDFTIPLNSCFNVRGRIIVICVLLEPIDVIMHLIQ